MVRARITVAPPPGPGCATSKTPEEAGFFAGAALAALHPIAGARAHTEDEAALRDVRYLRRAGDDPTPAGRLLQAWRRLAARDPLDKTICLVQRPKDWMIDLTNSLDVPLDDALADVGDVAKTLAVGERSAIAAAAEVAAVPSPRSRRRSPVGRLDAAVSSSCMASCSWSRSNRSVCLPNWAFPHPNRQRTRASRAL